MKLIQSILILFGLTGAIGAKAQLVQIAGENVCTECSVLVKSLMDRHRVVSPSPNPGQTRVAVALSYHPHLRYLERLAINQIGQRLAVTSFGDSLLAAARKSQSIQYKLFYQIGVDDHGLTSLNNETGLATYVLDRRDPHEMWGFFQNRNKQGTIYINEYQNPWNAAYTLIHELFHLLDEKTGQHIRSRQNEEWMGLDDLVLEFRAQLAETVFRKQQIEVQSRSAWKEITGQKDFHDQFIRGTEIQVEKIAEMVIDVMYPLKVAQAKELAFDVEAPIYEVLGQQKRSWRVPTEILQEGIMDAISWFIEESNSRKLDDDDDASALHVALLRYKSSLPDSAFQWAKQKRAELAQELKQRRAQSFFEYLKMQGLFDDLYSGFKFRSDALNQYGPRTGGPSPRLGGGTRFSERRSEALKPESEAEPRQSQSSDLQLKSSLRDKSEIQGTGQHSERQLNRMDLDRNQNKKEDKELNLHERF